MVQPVKEEKQAVKVKITFPVVIRHENDPELTYLENLKSLAGMGNDEIDSTDTLIDVNGNTYSIEQDKPEKPYTRTGNIDLKVFLGLVKAHAANRGSCCVAKLYAPDFIEAMKLVASLEDD